MLTPEELRWLLAGKSISGVRPWSLGKLRQVDNWCRALCESIAADHGLEFRMNLSDEDDSFVSFIDGWFYRDNADFVVTEPRGSRTIYLIVSFCRLTPVFCFGEGASHRSNNGRSDMQYATDVFTKAAVDRLANELQPAIESHGVARLTRKKGAALLPEEVDVSRLHGRPPFKEFDAYFHRRMSYTMPKAIDIEYAPRLDISPAYLGAKQQYLQT